MKTPHGIVTALSIVLVASTAFGAQIALPTPLSNLLGTGDFVSNGGLNFENFTYAATGDMPPATAVNVLATTDGDGNPGLRFQAGFIDTPAPGASDALITYAVTAASAIIADAHLGGNPALLGGTGIASVTDTFLPDIVNDSITVFDNGTVEQLSDWIIFAAPPAPFQQLQVQKDIILLAEAGGAGATISFIDQTYSIIPEPTSLTALVVGVLALGVLRRRRPQG